MRRTAALLLLPLFLVLVLGEEVELVPHGDGWKYCYSGESVEASSLRIRHAMDLLPALLLLAACLGRPNPAQPLLQAIGCLWLVALWGRLILESQWMERSFLYAIPFLGMALVCLLEALFYPRRPPAPDPGRRFAMATLGVLALQELAALIVDLRSSFNPPFSWPFLGYRLTQLSLPLGTAAILLLAAWGLRRGTRWASWLGCLSTSCLLAVPLYEFAAVFVLRPDVRDRTAWFYFIGHFPTHLLLGTVAILLAIRIRRDRIADRHEAPASR